MAHLEAELVKLTQERDVSVVRAKHFSIKVQCLPELGDEAKKLCERVLDFETTARATVLKGGKSQASRSEQKETDVEAVVEQARVEVDARNIHVAKLEAPATELEKQLEQSAS